MPDTPVWEDIRRAYADHSIPITEILATFGITAYGLTKLRRDNGWPMRPNPVVAKAGTTAARKRATAPRTKAKAAAPDAVAAPPVSIPLPYQATPKRITPIAQRRALVARLTNAIDTKLKLLERRFERQMAGIDTATGKGVSAADTERDIRAIGLLIKNLEHVTDYDHGRQLGKSANAKALSGAAAKSASLAASALADEADRLRRELGERLQRLVDPAQ